MAVFEHRQLRFRGSMREISHSQAVKRLSHHTSEVASVEGEQYIRPSQRAKKDRAVFGGVEYRRAVESKHVVHQQ